MREGGVWGIGAVAKAKVRLRVLCRDTVDSRAPAKKDQDNDLCHIGSADIHLPTQMSLMLILAPTCPSQWRIKSSSASLAGGVAVVARACVIPLPVVPARPQRPGSSAPPHTRALSRPP